MQKGYVPNWFEDVFVIKKVKNTFPLTYVISDLKGEEIVETFYEKDSYDSSFNSWIEKKDSINEWIFSRIEIFKKSESWIRFV